MVLDRRGADGVEGLGAHPAKLAEGDVEKVRTEGDGIVAELRRALLRVPGDDEAGILRVELLGSAVVLMLRRDRTSASGPLGSHLGSGRHPASDAPWIFVVVKRKRRAILAVTEERRDRV